MKDFLQRYSVGKRMTGAFALLLALMATIAIVASLSLTRVDAALDEIAQTRTAKTRLANTLFDAANQVYIDMQGMLLAESDQDRLALRDHLLGVRDNFGTTHAELAAMPGTERGKALVAAAMVARNQAVQHNQQVIELALAGNTEVARAYLNDHAIAGLQAWQDAAQAIITHEAGMSEKARMEAESASRNARIALWSAFSLAVLAGLVLAVTITRSLTQPLALAANAAHALAEGRLDGEKLVGHQDEAGEVINAIQATRDSLSLLINGLQEMGRRHDAGEVSWRMDASTLQGDYLILARLLDAQISEHINAAFTAGRLAARYAVGDLSEDFPRVPGEKAVVMEAMDNVKSTIGRISSQIGHLSEAAVRGDFSVRGDETAFQFGFRDMVANLNQLMATADGSLSDLSQVLRGIASGDLTVRMHGQYQGVFAQMRDDANTTVDNLTQIVARIQLATGHITSASGEIASGNADLSRRTEQQAANLEETAASMEELTSTVRQNAEHAQQANQLAIGAADVATSGSRVVGEVVDTMAQIEESSRRIADIISVIDGIAFQTNILALNAAVEAARAGEQGRGFAVVASEVRTLAQRSATAAKEIKELIDNSVERVASGSSLVHQAGQTMDQIMGSVGRVTDIMAEISAASQEQTSGIEQVSHTVMQMDETTQQNAALVEEASAAARAMADQADQLAQAVSVFRIDPASVRMG